MHGADLSHGFHLNMEGSDYVEGMNENEMAWMRPMFHQDTLVPVEKTEGEESYTMLLDDFHKMPVVNFVHVASMDAHVRSLFN